MSLESDALITLILKADTPHNQIPSESAVQLHRYLLFSSAKTLFPLAEAIL